MTVAHDETGYGWLLRAGLDEPRGDFAARAHRYLQESGASIDEFAVTEDARPPLNLLSLSSAPLAFVLSPERPPEPPPELTVCAYALSSTLAVDGPRAGSAMLTLLQRRRGLDDATFLARWHEGHSPLAIEVHPLVRYARHVVVRAIDGAPPLDGVVLEHVAQRADLLSPVRYFGGALRMAPNLVRVALDAHGFLDLGAIENYLVEVRVAR